VNFRSLELFQRTLRHALAVAAVCLCTSAAQTALAQNQSDVPANHPFAPVINLAMKGQEATQKVKDYEAVLTKREYIGKELVTSQMEIKVRHEPFSVYLKFREPHAGREVLYVAGQNGGKILAHEGSGLSSLIGTVSLDVNSREALKENRYPITMIGIRNMVSKLIEQWEVESQYGECEVKYYPNAQLGNVECRVVETSHPVPRRQFKYSTTRLYLDKETNLPIRCECYGFPVSPGEKAPLIEEYTYTNLRTNTGLTDFDFDRNNPAYQF